VSSLKASPPPLPSTTKADPNNEGLRIDTDAAAFSFAAFLTPLRDLFEGPLVFWATWVDLGMFPVLRNNGAYNQSGRKKVQQQHLTTIL